MRFRMIGTWDMALEGLGLAQPLLEAGKPVEEAIAAAIRTVEDNPAYDSVGFGGMPNSRGLIELDAAYMHGDTLMFGGIMGVSHIKNPIDVAVHLSVHRRNCLLSGQGAEAYAQANGFPFANMLAPGAAEKWRNDKTEAQASPVDPTVSHDTVCIAGIDAQGRMGVGVSTSGLYRKHPGRIGDSPIIGSGFYCDGRWGAAAATGLGEDIMKGCLSHEIVRLMRQGLSPQAACETALNAHGEALGERGYTSEMMAVVAMSPAGLIGAASNLPRFPFAVIPQEGAPLVMEALLQDGKTLLVVKG